MGQLLLGAAIGLVVSLIAWWLVTRWPLPTLRFSEIGQDASQKRKGCWRYRVKVVSLRLPRHVRRPQLIDVKVVATLLIKGLDPRDPEKQKNYGVPIVKDGRISVLKSNSIVELRVHELDLESRSQIASYVRRANEAAGLDPDGPPDLQAILALEPGASKLRFRVTATHAYTNATTTRIVEYDDSNIKRGKFRRGSGRRSLQIVSTSTDER
jgi:hypothetical protein